MYVTLSVQYLQKEAKVHNWFMHLVHCCVLLILIVCEKLKKNKKSVLQNKKLKEGGVEEQILYLQVVYFREEGLVLILDHLRLQLLSIWSQCSCWNE